ncbi:MAG: flagellar biosynthesis protein FliQ [Nitrospirae bacterium]|nr:flagellar biosynthesis protein FliQ [Nitrospirota bacterium]
MTQEFVMTIARRTMEMTFLVAAPALAVAMIAGVLISLFQAVTQLQEMTLTFVPKIALTGIALIVFGPWMLQMLLDFMVQMLSTYPLMLAQ